MIVRVMAMTLLLAASWPIAKAHLGFECIAVVFAAQLLSWPVRRKKVGGLVDPARDPAVCQRETG